MAYGTEENKKVTVQNTVLFRKHVLRDEDKPIDNITPSNISLMNGSVNK